MFRLCRLTILLQLFGCFRSEVFTLFESNHADSETKCTHGYIGNLDTIVFKSRINITANQGISTANFEIVSSHGKSLRYICDIEIPTDCTGIEDGTSKCPCIKLDGATFQLTLNVNASTRFNKANVTGHYYNSIQGSIKKTVPMPEVYDSSNASGILVINDNHISTNGNGCMAHVNDLPLKVNFSCLSPARPCLIEMLMHDTNSTAKRFHNITSLLINNIEGPMDTMFLHINFAACRPEGKIKSLDCLIKKKLMEPEAESNVETENVLFAILGILIFIPCMALIILVYTRFRNTQSSANSLCHPECLKHKPKKEVKIRMEENNCEANPNDTHTDGRENSQSADSDQSIGLLKMSSVQELDLEGVMNSQTADCDHSTELPRTGSLQERDQKEINMYATFADRKYSTASTLANLEDDDEPYLENGEIQILNSYNGVLDFEKEYDSCDNQEDHKSLIDVEDFDVNHLPVGFQDPNFKNIIQLTSDLTVLLTVYVGTDEESRRHIKMGNGFVGHVILYDDDLCSCRNCLISKAPSTQYAIVVVYTSSYVVSSDCEGLKSTCQLFYDNRDSQTFILSDYMQGKIDGIQKKFKLNYITCNQDIIKRLKPAFDTWLEQYPKINSRYKKQFEKGKWIFIVSHVHGLHKRISIGNVIDNPERHSKCQKNKVTQYTYKAPTCFGSTGAYVYLISRAKKGWLTQHFHHGRLENGQKFSGKGVDYCG